MQYVRAYTRFWWLIVGSAALGLAVSALVGAAIPTAYQSTVDVAVVRTPIPRGTDPATRSSLIVQANTLVAQRLGTYEVATRNGALAKATAAEMTPKPDTAALAKRLTVDAPERSTVLIVTARDSTPARARALAARAGSAMASLVSSIESQALQGRPVLRGQVLTASLTPAQEVDAPAWRNSTIILVAFVLIGLALAASIARIRPRLRESAGSSGVDGVPTLVAMNTRSGVLSRTGSGPRRYDRAVRRLRTAVFFMRKDPGSGLIVAMCPATSDRSTHTVARDLAVDMAATDARTLLVDADLAGGDRRDPGDETVEASKTAGLSDYLSGTVELKGLIRQEGTIHRLSAGNGVESPAELLHSPVVDQLLRGAADRYDYILVVAPAALSGTGAAALAARCDTTIVMAKDRLSMARLREALHLLETVDADVSGVVLTR